MKMNMKTGLNHIAMLQCLHQFVSVPRSNCFVHNATNKYQQNAKRVCPSLLFQGNLMVSGGYHELIFQFGLFAVTVDDKAIRSIRHDEPHRTLQMMPHLDTGGTD